MSTSNVAILIPAYKPSARLIETIGEIRRQHDGEIIVVDDGGGKQFAETFTSLRAVERVTVLANAVNLGKGAALKHGINHALVAFPNLTGIVTADADGQHAVEDILAVATELGAKPDDLVMGYRSFGTGAPLRSLIGNNVSRAMYRALLGLKLRDTQTGLRGLPLSLCRAALAIRSNRYEFETEMLSVGSSLGLPIAEVPIRTIYEDSNASSHFDPFFDSLRIYFVVLRYALASAATSIVDFTVFAVLFPLIGHTIAANLASRFFALFVQFGLLRSFVFHSKAGLGKFAMFVAYVAATGLVSGVLQAEFTRFTGWTPLLSKALVEIAIFVFNFMFMREILFRKDRRAAATD